MLALDRETAIIIAFATLIGAGIFVSTAAWILLGREFRRGRAPKAAESEGEIPAGDEAPEDLESPVPTGVSADGDGHAPQDTVDLHAVEHEAEQQPQA